MYVHIGNDVAVREDEILGIFDLDGQTIPRTTGEYLRCVEKEGRLRMADVSGLPKSFVLLSPRRSLRRAKRSRPESVILSCLSASALGGRASLGQL